MKNTSDRVEAARKKVIPAAEDFVHTAADRVGPLAQSAADKVGPLAEAAAERIGAAAEKVVPFAHTAAERVSPYAQQAVDRVSPYAQQAVDRVSPYAQQAVDAVSPYAHQAVDAVSPYAHQAADKIAPLAESAVQRGARVAHDAVERFGPVLDDARDRVSEDLLPKLSGALSAAAATPLAVEAVSRGQATLAAAKGELVLPQKKKGSWLKRFAIVAAIAGVAFVVARKFLGSKDADWQAARPTTPYAPPKPAAPAAPVVSESAEAVAEAGDDPQSGPSAHADYTEANGAPEPEQPAEGGEPEAEGFEPEVTEPEVTEPEVTEHEVTEPEVTDAPAAKWSGQGVYVGAEPPEGFIIKGNERSMKYHLPESTGYTRTIAEVWFNSEEAAQEAGFVRAQR
ncbi:MAG TPA: hypothetical protein VIT20_01135 [Propionibacteriaceae bacterium]